VVLYGMIGLLGAKIWKENQVDFANPINLVPIAAGIVIGIGDVALEFTEDFTLTGIALGTIVAIGAYHLAMALAPEELRNRTRGAVITTGAETYPGGDEDSPRT
jgi:xanthine/uracil permease